MKCNTGQRRLFVDDLISNIQDFFQRYDLKDVVIHRKFDPISIAARGDLKSENDASAEHVEIILQISHDLQAAERINRQSASATSANPPQVAKVFDLSDIVNCEASAGISPQSKN